jgi:hypothetical protein
MFGKDIDEFLEDSEWDIESIDKMSQFSKGSKGTIKSAEMASKLKGMEKAYLQKLEHKGNALQTTGSAIGGVSKPKHKGKFRDTDSEYSKERAGRPGA